MTGCLRWRLNSFGRASPCSWRLEAKTPPCKSATTTIPIVFLAARDPTLTGLVASLSRPGGNATGVNLYGAELAAKRLGLLHDLVPTTSVIGVLLNPPAISRPRPRLERWRPRLAG